MLNLFAQPPENHRSVEVDSLNAPQAASADHDGADDQSEEEKAEQEDVKAQGLFIKHQMVYYLQNPEKVNEYLSVERYADRWPLIPPAELHASSIQHPLHPEWRWLLHSRRVPVQASANDEASSVADDRPRCAGIGDENCHVWSCWDCLMDVAAQNPKMPVNACANDNWIIPPSLFCEMKGGPPPLPPKKFHFLKKLMFAKFCASMYTFFSLTPQNWALVASNRLETGRKGYSKSFSPWVLNIINFRTILILFMGVQR